MKKAELTLQIIVVAILALIVLIVLAYAFRTQISNLLGSFSELISGASESAKNIDIESLVN